MAREYIDEHDGSNPFYMLVSFCSPHRPYDAPKRYLDMFPEEDWNGFVLQPGESLTGEERRALNRQIRNYKAMITLIDVYKRQVFTLSYILFSFGVYTLA